MTELAVIVTGAVAWLASSAPWPLSGLQAKRSQQPDAAAFRRDPAARPAPASNTRDLDGTRAGGIQARHSAVRGCRTCAR